MNMMLHRGEPRAIVGLRAARARESRRKGALASHIATMPEILVGGLTPMLEGWTSALKAKSEDHDGLFREAADRGDIVGALRHRGPLQPWRKGAPPALRLLHDLVEAHGAAAGLPAIIRTLTGPDPLTIEMRRDPERARPRHSDWRAQPSEWWKDRHPGLFNRVLDQAIGAHVDASPGLVRLPAPQVATGMQRLGILLVDSDLELPSTLRTRYEDLLGTATFHATDLPEEALALLRANPATDVVLLGSMLGPDDGPALARTVLDNYRAAVAAIAGDPAGIVFQGGHDGTAALRTDLLDELIYHLVD
jgi:CheY-like chemotaxis protein